MAYQQAHENRQRHGVGSMGREEAVFAGATHAVLSGPAVERLEASAIEELVLLNTVPLAEEKKLEKMKFLSVAPLFAEAISRIFTNGSISVLFD